MDISYSEFGLPSAKNLSLYKTVEYFVPTDLYWKMLFSDGNDLIFGTRGSGKTMLLRMMSFSHLYKFSQSNTKAHEALYSNKRFGVYLSLGVDWYVTYQKNIDNQAIIFREGINLTLLEAFLKTLNSIIYSDVISLSNKEETERELVQIMAERWFRYIKVKPQSILALRTIFLNHQTILPDLWRFGTPPNETDEEKAGYSFKSNTLFQPLDSILPEINEILSLDHDHKWIICLDELENLHKHQSVMLSTTLRSTKGNLAFKITTLPYTFSGGETLFSEDATAVELREFSFRRLQYDPSDGEYKELANRIIRKKISSFPETEYSLIGEKIFGDTSFLTRAKLTDSSFEKQINQVKNEAITKRRLNDNSVRKLIPIWSIRFLKRMSAGNINPIAYSGWTTIIRLSDGNPAILIRILNDLNVKKDTGPIDPSFQHKVLSELATKWLEWSRGLYKNGNDLYNLIDNIGNQFQNRLHSTSEEDPAINEEISRFRVDLSVLNPRMCEAFKVGARHSLLVAEAEKSSVRYPDGMGVWRLSYALTPKYWLLPRRGKIANFASQLEMGFGRHEKPSIIDNEPVGVSEEIELIEEI